MPSAFVFLALNMVPGTQMPFRALFELAALHAVGEQSTSLCFPSCGFNSMRWSLSTGHSFSHLHASPCSPFWSFCLECSPTPPVHRLPFTLQSPEMSTPFYDCSFLYQHNDALVTFLSAILYISITAPNIFHYGCF